MRLTLRIINQRIAEHGYELVNPQNGYFYFVPLNDNYAPLDLGQHNGQPQSNSVSVYRLNHLTLESWVDELETRIENLRNNLSYDENNPRWFVPVNNILEFVRWKLKKKNNNIDHNLQSGEKTKVNLKERKIMEKQNVN